MKKRCFLPSVLITISLLLISAMPALAMPPIPSTFWGTVKLNGANVAAGTKVSAWIDGQKYAETIVQEYSGDTVYSLIVAGDDLATTGVVEGGVDGATVSFQIGNVPASQTGTWASGTNVQLNLTATVNTNVAPEISEGVTKAVTISEDSTPIAFSLNLNATDLNGDTLTWSISKQAEHGTATAAGVGTVKSIGYTPAADYNGKDAFTVQVSDGNGGTDTIVVDVTISPVNDEPVLKTIGNKAVNELSKLTFTAIATDVDGDALIFSLGTDAPAGAVLERETGVFSWTPAEAQGPGTYPITIRVYDGKVMDTETIQVEVAEVNTAPVAVDDEFVVEVGKKLTISVGNGLLKNDTDADGDPIHVKLVSQPAKGVLTLGQDGSFTYTPAEGFKGTISFTYRVNDGHADSNLATVRIAVTGIPVTGAVKVYIPLVLGGS